MLERSRHGGIPRVVGAQAQESVTHPLTHPADAPVVPTRFRAPLKHVVDDFMPAEFVASFARWAMQHRSEFFRDGDVEGDYSFHYTHRDFDTHDLATTFRTKLVAAIPEALGPCCVPEFDLQGVEQFAALFHHGAHEAWHDDIDEQHRRRLGFVYTMHSEPRMFTLGDIEFVDGTTVEPKNNRLVFLHPLQQHRTRRVECWSAHVLHGCWTIRGWLLGAPPEGWRERVDVLRAT